MKYPVRRETLIVPNPLDISPRRGVDAFGLRRRAHLAPIHRTPPSNEAALSTPAAAARFLAGLGDLPQEQFVVVPLDNRNRPIGAVVASKGAVNESVVHPREVIAPVIEARATAFLVAHNHPSGTCQPSLADEVVTKRIAAAGRLVGVPLLDHLVVGHGCHSSLRERAPSLFDGDGGGREVVASNGRNPMPKRRKKNPLTRAEQAKILREARDAVREARLYFRAADPTRARRWLWFTEGLLRANRIGGGKLRHAIQTLGRRQSVTVHRYRNPLTAKEVRDLRKAAAVAISGMRRRPSSPYGRYLLGKAFGYLRVVSQFARSKRQRERVRGMAARLARRSIALHRINGRKGRRKARR